MDLSTPECKTGCVLGEAHYDYYRRDEYGTVWNIIIGDINAPGVYAERIECMDEKEYEKYLSELTP